MERKKEREGLLIWVSDDRVETVENCVCAIAEIDHWLVGNVTTCLPFVWRATKAAAATFALALTMVVSGATVALRKPEPMPSRDIFAGW